METRNGNTKQRILEQSLDLFATYGYEGVSVKQIAAAVGIKDSSLYKHYESKQEIFDTLLAGLHKKFLELTGLYRSADGTFAAAAVQYGENGLEWLRITAETLFRLFLEDQEMAKFLQILTIEQYHLPQAAALFRESFFELPLSLLTGLFTEMTALGYLAELDPEAAALQFYSPVHLLLIHYGGRPDHAEDASARLVRHLEQFTLQYALPAEDGPEEETD